MKKVISTCLRWFLTFALRILSVHNLWRHLAGSRTRAYWKHGGFALMWALSVEKWLSLNNEHGHPTFFSSHCNEIITSFAWEKTDLISTVENWINKREKADTVLIFSILPFDNHAKKFGSNFNQWFSVLSKSNLKCLFVSDTMYWRQFNACSEES